VVDEYTQVENYFIQLTKGKKEMSILFEQAVDALKLVDHKNVLESGLFSLGGSRYMATKYPDIIKINENTDWDFYCDVNDTAAVQWIADNGIYMVSSTAYPFDDLAEKIVVGNDFQIIVRKDAVKYKRVLDLIDPEFYRDYLWKSGPNKPGRGQIQAIFNQLFSMV
jgi:hypothetical protein